MRTADLRRFFLGAARGRIDDAREDCLEASGRLRSQLDSEKDLSSRRTARIDAPLYHWRGAVGDLSYT